MGTFFGKIENFFIKEKKPVRIDCKKSKIKKTADNKTCQPFL